MSRDTPQWKTFGHLLAFKAEYQRWPVEKQPEEAELYRFRTRICRVLRGETKNIEAWPAQLLSEARRAKIQQDNPRRAGPPLPSKGPQAEMLARLQAGQQLSAKELHRLRYSYSNGNLSDHTVSVFAQYGIKIAA